MVQKEHFSSVVSITFADIVRASVMERVVRPRFLYFLGRWRCDAEPSDLSYAMRSIVRKRIIVSRET